MCDTLALVTSEGVWLAKNSDRHPDEAQRVEYHPVHSSLKHSSLKEVACTYITVKVRKPQSYSMIIGRPDWMWGAEMGVNDQGVAIGNEAVFTKFTSRQKIATPKLLGMDLLRLALMQAESAEAAIDCIAFYLETYGQGGNAGYGNKKFYYDNSFLIADCESAWVMETAGCIWAARPIENYDAISNSLIIGQDYQRANLKDKAKINFSSTYNAFLLPRLARATTRRRQNLQGLEAIQKSATGEAIKNGLAKLLGRHQDSGAVNTGNVCMHAKGFLCPDETVNSMIAFLPREGEPQVWMTGCSHPCRSEFHQVAWDKEQWFSQQPNFWESVKL